MIGFYAHHHGAGHLTRCRSITAAMAGSTDTAILSSDPGADLVLPLDAPASDTVSYEQLTANGSLHWAPPHHRGLAQRMAMVAAWIETHRPAAFHVDVSVEMAVFVRAMGVPVTLQAMPGIRTDKPHALGYGVADAVIAAWPDWVPLPVHLAKAGARVHAVGGISRFTAAGSPERTQALGPHPGNEKSVAIMFGAGGTDAPPEYWQDVAHRLRAAGHACILIGGSSWVADPLAALSRADVVVSAAGQNSIADLAALGKRTIVVPQARPFGEQVATARILSGAGLAVVPEPDADGVPDLGRWPALVERALMSDPDWQRWQTTGAADRAARVLLEVAG